MKSLLLPLSLVLFAIYSCVDQQNAPNSTSDYPNHVFEYTDNLQPRWSSFENLNGQKGRGGLENNGAKGHPYDIIKKGEKVTLLDIEGPGIINRIWLTIPNRSPQALRGLLLNMYWDQETRPAVSVPLGDFFSVGLGKTAVFENSLFASPEGRSFNSFVQMPFRKGAKIEIVNELDVDMNLLFFDVDYQLMKRWNDDFLYFHAYWRRDTATTLAQDFEILPKVQGKGRYLGTVISVIANPKYKDYWWGEGEVKVYLDGDTDSPTLNGTGTEDYIGSGWGQDKYFTRYMGCSVADPANLEWSFYRFHLIDPIYFHSDCKVTIQQIGGSFKKNVVALQKAGVALIPVTLNDETGKPYPIYTKDGSIKLEEASIPSNDDPWTNFYRSDDFAAVAYFYLDRPANDFPAIQGLAVRTWKLRE